MVLTHIDLKYVSLIYRKIRQKVPNGKGLMYKNTHTQNKNSAKKKNNKQTNNPPPPPPKNKTKHFRVLFESITGCKDSIPIFYLKRKREGSDSVVWHTLSHREQHQ